MAATTSTRFSPLRLDRCLLASPQPAFSINHPPFVILSTRGARHQAFDSGFRPEDLAEARKWKESFTRESLPKGKTTFSRSSGPGGQHINKTESKATTVWTVGELYRTCPTLLHTAIKSSKYYTPRSESLTVHADVHRARSANAEENQGKLFSEICRIYDATVPGVQSAEKTKKYENLMKSAKATRLKEKRAHSAKKQLRKGGGGGDY